MEAGGGGGERILSFIINFPAGYGGIDYGGVVRKYIDELKVSRFSSSLLPFIFSSLYLHEEKRTNRYSRRNTPNSTLSQPFCQTFQ